jgi:hypothetical protein
MWMDWRTTMPCIAIMDFLPHAAVAMLGHSDETASRSASDQSPPSPTSSTILHPASRQVYCLLQARSISSLWGWTWLPPPPRPLIMRMPPPPCGFDLHIKILLGIRIWIGMWSESWFEQKGSSRLWAMELNNCKKCLSIARYHLDIRLQQLIWLA